MLTLRRSTERGHADYGWLNTHHTFSFAEYFDPAYMGYRSLRVINEDRVAPGHGFGMHGHQDMEILSYVLSGELEHKDSLGNGSVLRVGDFQRISAGHGILHSEFNPSNSQPVHFYQIWLRPRQKGGEPSYEQRHFAEVEKAGRWRLVADSEGTDGALRIQQEARIWLASLSAGQSLDYTLPPGRSAWLQVLRGSGQVDEWQVAAGDGVAVSLESLLTVTADEPSEWLLFDLV